VAVSYSINVVLIDDDINSCHIIEDLLDDYKRINLRGYATDIGSFQLLVKKTKPDVALMDINMPEMDGVETTRQALQKYPDLHILVLSMYSDIEYYNTMIELGVKGFILKDIDNNELGKLINYIR